MRSIKAFLAGLLGLFFIVTLFSLLIPSRVRVSRAVHINNTSVGEVYRQIANIENWQNWHPVFIMESARITRHDPGINGKYASAEIKHRGKKVIISMISADSAHVVFLLKSDGENDIENELVTATDSSQQSVQVEWRAITKLRWYPWEKFYGIFIDQLTGSGYENALNGLKNFIEKPPSAGL